MSFLTLVYQTDPDVVLTLGSDRVYFQVSLDLLELSGVFRRQDGDVQDVSTYIISSAVY